MTNVLYLPLDERPCNRVFAAKICRGTPVTLICPDKSILGDKKNPADSDAVVRFLTDNAANASACVLSLDMLLYGGIVPSRLHNLTQEQLDSRLDAVERLVRINPKLKIYGFSLIMRCPSYDSDDEEPAYYATNGRDIFLYGQTLHKVQEGVLDKNEGDKLLASLRDKIGNDNLSDFENRRKTNLSMLKKILQKRHLFEQFVIPQDDSSEWGYTTLDRAELRRFERQQGLQPTPMYPGADEVGMSLLSRAVCDLYDKHPRVACFWAAKGAPDVVPLFEDRPVGKTLPVQLSVAGCLQTSENADIELYLNYPDSQPKNVGETPSEGYAARDLQAFCSDIAQAVKSGKVVAVADGAYCNGGDERFVETLQSKIQLTDLASYAGWNTSSNTLGTAICAAVFVWLFGKTKFSELFVAERFAEDLAYCGFVRKYVCDNILPQIGLDYFHADGKNGKAAEIVKEQIAKYMQIRLPQIAQKYVVCYCALPWQRMFETELDLVEK